VIATALGALGQDAEHWLARGRDEETKSVLRARTEEAARHGIFGAPTFRIGRELFWGDDRLEEAMLWALETHPGLAREPRPSASQTPA
jgi:2-hydroxychromene-2-carboxylate isomerase